MDMNVVWLAGVIVFVVLEAVTYQLVSIWFAFGAAGALIASLCGAGIYLQLGIFLAIAILLLLILRPFSIKLVKHPDVKTNADSLIGKQVLITEEVNNISGHGKGKVNGMTWTVRSEDNEVISEGALPEVVRIEGVKLIVKGGK